MPDISPFLKFGLIGIVLFALVLALIILYRVINAWTATLGGKTNINGSSGSRPVEYWELTFARIVKQQLDEHEHKVRRPERAEAAQMRQDLMAELKHVERQIALAVVELSRIFRER